MKITATSIFHGGLSVSFTRIQEGLNIRRLRGARSNYCLDYVSNNSISCGCGYPTSRTRWDAPVGYEVVDVRECGIDGSFYGQGYVAIHVRPCE